MSRIILISFLLDRSARIEDSQLTSNQVIGSVNTMLSTICPDEYANSNAQSNVASIAFAGTVVGHLFFGWVAD
jgi:hypothetical protein